MLVAAWFTAIATGMLAVFAVATAWYARKAFMAQSEEIGMIQQDRQRDAEERRWAQARRVYLDLDMFVGNEARPSTVDIVGRSAAVTATMHNTGDRPVYDVRIHWVSLNPPAQAGVEDQLGTLGPHGRMDRERPVPDAVAIEQFKPIAYFRDAAGLRWTVTPNGYVAPVDQALVAGAPLIGTNAAAQAYPRS
jgi:hypothetical protein